MNINKIATKFDSFEINCLDMLHVIVSQSIEIWYLPKSAPYAHDLIKTFVSYFEK